MKLQIVLLGMFALIACACGPVNSSRSDKQALLVDAARLVQHADGLLKNSQPGFAFSSYEVAYQKFSLADDAPGKARSLKGMVKSNIVLGDRAACQKWLSVYREVAFQDKSLNDNFNLLLCEYYYRFSLDDSLLGMTDFNEIKKTSLPLYTNFLSYRLLTLLRGSKEYGYESSALQKLVSVFKDGGEDEVKAYPLEYSFALYTIGYMNARQGKWAAARPTFLESLNLDKANGNFRGTADNLYAVGVADKNLGDYYSAAGYFLRAREMYQLLADASAADEASAEYLMARLELDPSDTGLREQLNSLQAKLPDGTLKTKIMAFKKKKNW